LFVVFQREAVEDFGVVRGRATRAQLRRLWVRVAVFAGDGFLVAAVGGAAALFLWVFVEKVVGFLGDVVFDAIDDLVGELAVGKGFKNGIVDAVDEVVNVLVIEEVGLGGREGVGAGAFQHPGGGAPMRFGGFSEVLDGF